MAFYSKETKIQRMEMVDKEDRISSLPDDILSQIMSFLDLREAVKTTCVLSKRWEKVWTLIQCIQLDNKYACTRNLSYEERDKRRRSFINFVNRVLTVNNSSKEIVMTSFCLSYDFGVCVNNADEISNVVAWIAAAATPNLQKLDLLTHSDWYRPHCKMPATFFECQKLVTLKLDCYKVGIICLDVPKRVRFSSLEKLHLLNVEFEDENSLKNLLAGCPVLEELYLIEKEEYNFSGEDKTFFVLSPSLKIIRFEHLKFVYPYEFHRWYVVEAPRLEHLDVLVYYLSGFSMSRSTSSSLVSAVIHIFNRFVDSPLSIVELFQGIFNVQKLELSTRETMIFENEFANIPEFRNLIHLKIGQCDNSLIVPCILQHSPHLKHLIFDKCHFYTQSFKWNPPNPVPKCLILHLETIEILSLLHNKRKEAMEMVQYLLDKGKVLKKMVITTSSDEELGQLIMGFPKASVGCQISIRYSGDW